MTNGLVHSLKVRQIGAGRPPAVLTRVGLCLPEAVAEVMLSTSHLTMVSGGLGKQTAFEVEFAAALHKWLTYSSTADENVVRELSTGKGAKKSGGKSIDVALLKGTAATALIELKILREHPGFYKNKVKGFAKGDAKPLKLGEDLELLRRAQDPVDSSWRRTQRTALLAIAVCLTDEDIEQAARSAEQKGSGDMKLRGIQQFAVLSRSAGALQGVQAAYFVATQAAQRKPKT